MNKKTKGTYRVIFILAVLLPFYGCSESDNGGAAKQAQPAPATETATEVAVTAPATETITVDVEEGVPGGILTETLEVSATVTAVDAASRGLILQNSDGDEFAVQVGPQAVNFDQIQVGDVVNATIIKELVVGLMPEHATTLDGDAAKALGYIEAETEAVPDGTAAIVARAAKGAQPGGLMGQTTQITATIDAIDEVNRTATLSLEDGSTRTIPVRDDIDLTQHKAGEKVVFYITEMIAISVEKP